VHVFLYLLEKRNLTESDFKQTEQSGRTPQPNVEMGNSEVANRQVHYQTLIIE